MTVNDMRLYLGDCLDILPTLEAGSVQTCVTSPPYFGLRNYGHDDQIGLESTPYEYVAKLVDVFRLVRRVLRADGTLWLNLGDSYNGSGKGPTGHNGIGVQQNRQGFHSAATKVPGLKPKDLIGIPWLVAFALRADGWYLRSDIIWAKPNPMPESVTDRPTKAHEYIFLLAKGQWKSRVISFSNLDSQRFHFSEYFRLNGKPMSLTTRLPVDLATTIFDCAQSEDEFCLPPFYSEVWQQGDDGSDSDFVSGLPEEYRPAVWAARFLTANATAKQFLCEIDRLRVTHADSNYFLKRWTRATSVTNAPSITCDREGTLSIHYSGEICKIDFSVHELIISQPRECSYFYDADAIAEPLQSSTIERYRYGWNGVNDDGSNGAKTGSAWKEMKDGATMGEAFGDKGTRNKRSVWTVTTKPYSGAHFATFPPDLIEPCILAGSKPGDTVLDPFTGSGTTGSVAINLGRAFVGCELNPDYVELAHKRIAKTQLPLMEMQP